MKHITLQSSYRKEPFFFKLSHSSNIPKDKMMTTNDWNLVIELLDPRNTDLINNTISRLAFAENKVIYGVNKDLNIITPAIITSMEDEPDIITVSLIINSTMIYVMKHSDLKNFTFFNSKSDAENFTRIAYRYN